MIGAVEQIVSGLETKQCPHCKTKAWYKQFRNPSQDIRDRLPYIVLVGSLCLPEILAQNVHPSMYSSLSSCPIFLSGEPLCLTVHFICTVSMHSSKCTQNQTLKEIEKESVVNGLSWKCVATVPSMQVYF